MSTDTFLIEQDIEKLKRKVKNTTPSLPNNTIALIGDSITNLNGKGDDISSNGPTEYWVSALGYFSWANMLLNQRLKLVKQAGVTGNTTTQMLARLQTDIIDYNPGYCIVLGGTNDVASLDVETTKSNLLAIYKKLSNNGIKVIGCTIPQRTDSATWKTKIIEINNYIRSLSGVLKNFIVCDFYKAITSPANDTWFANNTTDGIHPIVSGAYNMGVELYETLDTILPLRPIFSGTNINDIKNPIANPYLLGGTTNASNWEVNTSANIVANKVAREKGLEWQQVENVSAGALAISVQGATTTGFTVGQRVSGYVEFELDAGATAIDYYNAHILTLNSSNGIITQSHGLDGWVIGYPQDITKGIIYIPRFIIPEGTAKLVINFKAKLIGKIRIGRTRMIVE